MVAPTVPCLCEREIVELVCSDNFVLQLFYTLTNEHSAVRDISVVDKLSVCLRSLDQLILRLHGRPAATGEVQNSFTHGSDRSLVVTQGQQAVGRVRQHGRWPSYSYADNRHEPQT